MLGLVSEASRPAMQALMIDIVPERDRVRAFSLHYWVINLGFAFAATTAGLVAGVDFRLLFVIDATTTVAAATLVAFTVKEPSRVRVQPPAPVPAPAAPGLRAVFADRVFLAFVGVNLLTSLVFMQHISTLPIAMAGDGLAAVHLRHRDRAQRRADRGRPAVHAPAAAADAAGRPRWPSRRS